MPTKTASGVRRGSAAIILLRLAGIATILTTVFSGPPPPSETGVGAIPKPQGRFVLSPASAAGVAKLARLTDEPEAQGCAASPSVPGNGGERIVVELRCETRGNLRIVIGHVPAGLAAEQERHDCLNGVSSATTCQVSGSIAEPLRGQLIAAFDRVFADLFHGDPFGLQQNWDGRAWLTAAAIAALITALWLAASGQFTFATWNRTDWVALLPFALALLVRERLVLHSIQEIEIQFAGGPVGRHSVVYPLFQLFYSRLVHNPQSFTFHINALLGALAVLPLYLFVRQRTESLAAAWVTGLLFAVHPMVARFAPTDSPYSFIFFTWFSGLALLSASTADARSTLGGTLLLGLAASARMDGSFYLAAALLMLGPGIILTRLRRTPAAALSGALAILLLIGVQMYFLLDFHRQGMHTDVPPLERWHEMWRATFVHGSWGQAPWAGLVLLGIVAGVRRRWRLGAGAFGGMLLLLLTTPFTISPLFIMPSSEGAPNAWHRMAPSAALQCIVTGIGAVVLTWPLTNGRRRRRWMIVLPGGAAALGVLVAYRSTLSESFVFNDEYALLRNHLVDDRNASSDCDLFVMTRVDKDADIRDFCRVLPSTHVLDCAVDNCVEQLGKRRCQYYLRSVSCFFHAGGASQECKQAGSQDDVLHSCLVPECAALESAAEMSGVEERFLNAWTSFPHEAWNYPERIPVGLFQVTPRSKAPPDRNEREVTEPELAEERSGTDESPCAADRNSPILPPSAAAPIQQAFASMMPALRYERIQIDGNHVLASVCKPGAEPASCFSVRLDPPGPPCEKSSGAFCVTFPDGAPPPADTAMVDTAFRNVKEDTIWVHASSGCDRPPPRLPTTTQPPPSSSRPATIVTAVALMLVPLGLGAVAGLLLRYRRGRRFAGVTAAILCIGIPVLMTTLIAVRWPLIGLWDALLEGLLIGIAAVGTAHRALRGRSEIALAAISLLASLLALELACRLWLPPPPAFPTAGGPHLLLADAMRASGQQHSWDLRSKEIVCSIVYGEHYPGIIDVGDEHEILSPRNLRPRAEARRRVLHLGDSMSFGFGLSRDQTFTADLERLEPGTQHINAGIPGSAPDAYLAVLQQWIALHDLDMVVMHVFEGNDLSGLDDSYPCCNWQSLFLYSDGRATERCPTASAVDFGKAGITWLRYNSPPPYLIRALVPYSAAAGHLAATIVNYMNQMPQALVQSEKEELQHLETILRTARDELRARHIPFVVDVLPARKWIGAAPDAHPAPGIVQVAERLELPVLDAEPIVREALAGGQQLFFDNPTDPHFNAVAHEILARWLHERLNTGQPTRP
ncbi:MAG: hypothetical protein HY270_01050 [Deltaproteobacteria bacterium]|nr:hypothetical protein [Deltaproteobacteria bacterium]